jgi:hypothetical protein
MQPKPLEPHRIVAVALVLAGALGIPVTGGRRDAWPAPGRGERIPVCFAIDAGLRAFYDDVPGLERKVCLAVAEVLQGNDGIRFWTIEPVPAPAAASQGLTVELLVKNGALRVRLRARSALLPSPSAVSEWTGRLVDPGELARTTTAGVPRESEVAPLVQAALERLLAANREAFRAAIWRGFPLGRITHAVPPGEEGDRFISVLPIDAADERNCCLKTSSFELRCVSSESTDTRLNTFGTGHSSEYPPSPGTPPDQRIHGVKVVLEAIRTGTETLPDGSVQPHYEKLAKPAHTDLVRSMRLELFFLRRLNEDAHECRTLGESPDLAVAGEEGGS